MKLNQAVIHELVKKQHKDIQKSIIKENLLPSDNEIVLKLVAGVAGLYGKKNNSAHYGIFNASEESKYFPAHFETFQSISPSTDDSFLTLTKEAMSRLKHYGGINKPSSGGYMLFANYENEQGTFFLAAMLKKKAGITLSDDLVPTALEEIDLNSLHQAARINLTRYKLYKESTDEERQDLSYLSFVSPRTTNSAAGYFVTALGCAKGTASAKATNTLVIISNQFFKDKPELKLHQKEYKDDLVRYLTICENKGKSATLSEVDKIARKYFPANDEQEADKLSDDLFEILNNDTNQVPVEFPVNKSTLKKHTHLQFTGANYQILLDKGILGTTKNATVQYDKAKRTLLFRNIPFELIELVEAELKESDEGQSK
ncbi:nucleoid-associated protein [Shewanella sp. M16]|uniref:nucleoid-associated protein n=1 Tax=Shewanella sp. M16 TaxID=2830837 RepID=UPI001BB06182|nr:nucleoid-associated protein [Shewanella sp. M16]MBS0041413.1 nucleoid-associated protein [Shewanella sp. M16]